MTASEQLDPLAAGVVSRAEPMALVLAGGAASALAAILRQPGASRVVLEGTIPYAREDLAAYLGFQPESACSAAVARALAWRAWTKARHLVAPGQPVQVHGVACTAALATQPPRRGADRAHFALCDGISARCWTLQLDKAVGRQEQEILVSQALLRLLANQTDPDLIHDPDPSADPLGDTLAGKRSWCMVHADGRISEGPAPGLVVSGSFNPLHAGHVRLARVAQKRTGLQAVFEITITNADKPQLPSCEVLRRLEPFGRLAGVAISRLGTFEAKAGAWPGATFVIGIDTAIRIVDPRFYGGTRQGLAHAMAHLRESGCRFLVAGRATEKGHFRTVKDLPDLSDIPGTSDLFEPIPESEFRLDLSSTDIREKRQKAAQPPG